MRRASYQRGTLRTIRRKDGNTVWEYRWRETQIDGTRRRRATIVGTLEDYPNASLVQTAVDALRLTINQQTPQRLIKSISFETLVNHYRQHELPDIFNKTKPGARCGGRRSQIVCDAGDLRGLLEEVDSSPLACLPADGHQGRGRGEMAEESLFSENWRSVGEGQQGQDQKHHERALLPCHPVGMGREESNHERSPELETAKNTRRSDPGRDHGISKGIARSTPHDDRFGCFHRIAPGRTDRASVAGCGFRKTVLHIRRSVVAMVEGAPKTEASLKDVPLDAQTGRIALGMEAAFSIHQSRRLGICLSAHERPTALLAGYAVAVLRQAGFGDVPR